MDRPIRLPTKSINKVQRELHSCQYGVDVLSVTHKIIRHLTVPRDETPNPHRNPEQHARPVKLK
jgi:hypothetical protein